MMLHRDGESGFTIIEMLAVVAVIATLATITVGAVSSAQRQARNAKCQANLHALHQATIAYLADIGNYPAASAYEIRERGSGGYYYLEARGWINWAIENKDCRRFGDDAIYGYDSQEQSYGSGGKTSQAAKFKYVGTGDTGDSEKLVRQSIAEGAIFKYAGKNYASYSCPDCEFSGAAKGYKIRRSYSMNEYFGTSKTHNPNLSNIGGTRSASRLAMFVEMNTKGSGKSCCGVKGTAGEKNDTTDYWDDSAWSKNEDFGYWHKNKSCNVIFADGHIESFKKKDFKTSDRDKIFEGKTE